MSVHVKSRPAISGLPTVLKNPGEMVLKRRMGGRSDSAYVRSFTKIRSLLLRLSMVMEVDMPASETPGIWRSFSRIACCSRATRSGSFTSVSGIAIRNV